MYAHVADYRSLYWPRPFAFLRPPGAGPVWWPRALPDPSPRGLGDMAPEQKQVVMSTPALVGGLLTVGGKSSIAALAWGTAAIPIIGAAVVGATIAISLLFSRKGPKQKVATTKIVEDVELPLRELVAGYWAGPRTVSSQRQALAAFDAGWQFILQNCGNPEMGDPGRRCISERDRGGIYDFFKAYRDPIAQDPDVRPDPQPKSAAADLVESVFGAAGSASSADAPGGMSTALLVGLGLVAAAAVLL